MNFIWNSFIQKRKPLRIITVETNKMSAQAKLNQIRTLIYNNQIRNTVNSVKNKDIAIILGNTRSGKSTVVNYMIGTPLKSNKVRNNVFNISKENPASAGPAIGTGPVSETSVPSAWTSPRFSAKIVDAPGFQDNRGEVQDIANAFYIKEIISNANSAKIILVSDINDIAGDNINSFISLVDTVNHMLPLGASVNPGIIMVFNKDRDGVTKEDIVTFLRTKIINQPALKISDKTLVAYLINHPNQIAVVKMPQAEGKVKEAEVFGNLMNVIQSQGSRLNKKVLSSISPGISDKSRTFLLEARRHLTELTDIGRIMSITLTSLDAQLKEFKELSKLKVSTQIPPMKKKITVIENKVKSIKNPSWNTKQLLNRMSQVFPSVQDLKETGVIYLKIEFIAFIDKILKINESNAFKVKINETIADMLGRINGCRNGLSGREYSLQQEENRIRLQKIKAEQDRQAELQRQELERQKRIQASINRDQPRPNPVTRVINNVIVRPIKKCSVM